MSYSDDVVRSKLLALNETQEGITGVAQWIMFHRRHADRTAQIWLQRVKESDPRKRLNLIYLANEVAQQSRARKKMEFVSAFSPVISEGTITAYKGAPQDIQQKLRRVIEVWRQRTVFDLPIQESVERGVDDLDKARGGAGLKKGGLGGSLFSSSTPSAPAEIQPLIPIQTNITKAEIAYRSVVDNATSEYDKIFDPTAANFTDPILAHRLNAVLKNLANAESAVAEGVKHRRTLIEALEKLLETNRAALAFEETTHRTLSDQKDNIDSRRREVEDRIMRGLSADPSTQNAPTTPTYDNEPPRPDVEEMTPPPMESLTPVDSPAPAPAFTTTTGADVIEEQPVVHHDRVPQSAFHPEAGISIASLLDGGAGTHANSLKRAASDEGTNGVPYKRRSMSNNQQSEEVQGIALDDDVAQMLG